MVKKYQTSVKMSWMFFMCITILSPIVYATIPHQPAIVAPKDAYNALYSGTVYDFVVAKDGSGDFKTIREAIDAIPDHRKKRTLIYIKKGVYKEKLVLPGSKQLVSFIGEDRDSTVLTFDDYASKKNRFGEETGTSGSASFYVYGSGFYAKNITFENASGPVGQAVALWVAGDKAHFENCRFLGFQDTLYTYLSRQYYNRCYIEGTVDFIFGSATALFDSCVIHCKRGGYVTAASTPEAQAFGYVFRNCKITGDPEKPTFDLGRPWRPYAKVVFMNCELGKHIRPAGWNNWGKATNEQTAYFAEYKNTGPGARKDGRVAWSHQLTDAEAANYSMENILGDWDPRLQ